MYEAILYCLTSISNNEDNKWTSKTMTGAFGLLLCAISSSAFVAPFQVNQCMFEYTVDLSKLLQGSEQVVPKAYKEITMVKDILSISDQMYSTVRFTRCLKSWPALLGQ